MDEIIYLFDKLILINFIIKNNSQTSFFIARSQAE